MVFPKKCITGVTYLPPAPLSLQKDPNSGLRYAENEKLMKGTENEKDKNHNSDHRSAGIDGPGW
jgi:hypothetical protein